MESSDTGIPVQMKGEIDMTLFQYMRKSKDWEITAWDKDYDVETYFYKEDGDEWDKAMNDLAKLLTVSEFSEHGVVVNLSEVIRFKLPELEKSDLFKVCNLDWIMADIEAILAGGVSEEWLTEFVKILGN